MIYCGEIDCGIDDRLHIEPLMKSFGGSFYFVKELHGVTTYHLDMPDTGMQKLDPYWGRFIWSLELRKDHTDRRKTT